ncbi:hypothetical protein E1211_16100 [Micromonospora sp. 15K316]|uniref:hypothetical protein n=1 Tax=Micromonospora sp. 15K316 TaxID=2530376 RepID=UPI00105106E5|nr:hypothetical protein [Micromonospora sp. 15K316]TDC35204.1 hypothetical protein E1211_16100 [Micromonospora sp. 15K316]
MDLALVVLPNGRDIALTEAHLALTYGGLLEGYPMRRLNDMIMGGLAQRAARVLPGAPVHVIDPPRTQESDLKSDSLPFGPVETLPSVIVMGRFSSGPVDDGKDPVLHRSQLVIVWLQHDAALPSPDAAPPDLSAVEWGRWAEDFEI